VTILWAALAALPFGWGIGLLAARILMGGDVGQMPALTIPIAMVGGVIFAVLPLAPARTRLNVLLVGAAFGFVLDALMAR
jgi:uncharacterized membrane protein